MSAMSTAGHLRRETRLRRRSLAPAATETSLAVRHDGRMSAGGYQSWFISARDLASPRALWIRHTTHRPRQGPESAALWCTVIDRDLGQRPIVVKQVFSALPADAVAGPRQFRGKARMGERTARWELCISGSEAPLRPLRPLALYRAPLPRTKLEASVPDGLLTGTLEVDDHPISVSGWRGTIGHNWGSEHADSWVWLHASGFGAAPDTWLELVLARIRIGGVRTPWTAMGTLSLDSERIPLGGLGRRPDVDVQPGRLTAVIASPGARLQLSVTTAGEDAVAVAYADPSGGSRCVRHAALAAVELTLTRPGDREVTMSTSRGAYEYGTRQGMRGIVLAALPEG
jgi:hypothetical protein